eukprot:gnl/Dysnectes_brevis/3411_a4296_916.p1 GENE.gnl/Dysnectes_brevis/3411_a4296_916~~gnl/Dysnectes_brevis/3411_a4296_916.p1  ORF type:complete len:138 (+),score=6.78 gnl/Dysnectes_brevis/3411_a4296_916:388-801(+)
MDHSGCRSIIISFINSNHISPIPPPGFVALGCLFQSGYRPPKLDDCVCIKKEYAVEARIGDWIWSDEGARGRSPNIGFWKVEPNDDGIVTNTFTYAMTHSHDRPSHKVYTVGKKFCEIRPTVYHRGLLEQSLNVNLY